MTTSAMQHHVGEMAAYNRWANRRIYADAATLPPDALHRNVGVYFKNLFATLEHILKVDRAWLCLLDGGAIGDLPVTPPAPSFAELRVSRDVADEMIVARMATVDQAWLDAPFEFRSSLESWRDLPYRGTRLGTLTHLFNHQTHHRGQAHTALSLLGVEPSALDLLVKGMLEE